MKPETLQAIRELQEHIYQIAKSKGWHEKERSPLEYHALIHSEVSEATEEVRNPESVEYEIIYSLDDKPEGECIEIADAVIRCFDYAASRGWDLAKAIDIKCRFNETREYRHGGKRY